MMPKISAKRVSLENPLQRRPPRQSPASFEFSENLGLSCISAKIVRDQSEQAGQQEGQPPAVTFQIVVTDRIFERNDDQSAKKRSKTERCGKNAGNEPKALLRNGLAGENECAW